MADGPAIRWIDVTGSGPGQESVAICGERMVPGLGSRAPDFARNAARLLTCPVTRTSEGHGGRTVSGRPLGGKTVPSVKPPVRGISPESWLRGLCRFRGMVLLRVPANRSGKFG